GAEMEKRAVDVAQADGPLGTVKRRFDYRVLACRELPGTGQTRDQSAVEPELRQGKVLHGGRLCRQRLAAGEQLTSNDARIRRSQRPEQQIDQMNAQIHDATASRE